MVEAVYRLSRPSASGLDPEAVHPASVVDGPVPEYPGSHRRAAEFGRATYHVHDGVTFGTSPFDDRVGLRAYDVETGTLRLFVDAGRPAALARGGEVFEHYREQARRPGWLLDGMADADTGV